MFLSYAKSMRKKYKDFLGRGRGSRGVEGREENRNRYVGMNKSRLCRYDNFIMKSITYTWWIQTLQNWRQLHGLSLGCYSGPSVCVLFLCCDMLFVTVALAVRCFCFTLSGEYSFGDLSLLCAWMNLETVSSSTLEVFIGMLLGMAWYI